MGRNLGHKFLAAPCRSRILDHWLCIISFGQTLGGQRKSGKSMLTFIKKISALVSKQITLWNHLGVNASLVLCQPRIAHSWASHKALINRILIPATSFSLPHTISAYRISGFAYYNLDTMSHSIKVERDCKIFTYGLLSDDQCLAILSYFYHVASIIHRPLMAHS